MKSKLFNLSSLTAVVTGGGSGIGKAISQCLAKSGAKVYILDIDVRAGEKSASEIKTWSCNAKFIECDVARQESVLKAFRLIKEPVDILINNAGIAHIGTVESTSTKDFQRLFDINVKGIFHCLKEGIKSMKKNGGSIVNIASVASLVGLPDRFAYSMTKGAVYSMTMSIAKDYIDRNIRCNCIAPGRIHTPFVDGFITENYPGRESEMIDKLSKTQPIGRMGRPEEVASLVLYLSSKESSFITGCCYPVDGGFITLNT